MGDYDSSTSFLNSLLSLSAQQLEINSDYSTNGDKSVKCNIISLTSQFFGVRLTSDLSGYVGKQLKFSIDIQTDNDISLGIYRKVDGAYSSTIVSIPSGSTSATVTSPVIEDNCTELWFRLQSSELPIGNAYSSDNWRLVEVEESS